MGSLKAWLKLTRAEHSIMSAAGVFVAIAIAIKAGQNAPDWVYLFAIFVPILINLGAFALNDYFDIDADKQNERNKRPLVSGEIEPLQAAGFGSITLLCGALLGFAISYEAGVISALFAAVSFLYNWKLKDAPLLGNLFIAISMGISFIFGAVAAGFPFMEIPLDFWILGAGAAAAGLGREIVKSVQDLEGDKKARGSNTLPVVIGEKNSLYAAAVFFVIFAGCVAWLVLYSSILEFSTIALGLLAIGALAYLTFAYLCAFAKMDEKRIESVRETTLEVLAVVLFAVLLCAL